MKRVVALIIVCILPACPVAAFEMDMSPGGIDESLGKMRLADLAVKDKAYIDKSGLCLKNGQLFAPSIIALQDGASEYVFSLLVTVGPGKKLTAKTVPPTKASEFKRADLGGFLRALREPESGIFSWLSPLRCEDLSFVSDEQGIELYPIESIDGFMSFRALFEDMMKRDYKFADEP